ncbi:unnamed protein product [Echinostoma caproni]|uniref:Secreted protein n=1 Tax=Echinostoma caproni TaxID=27848 RepID=A0A183A6C6_9TREM|nr:unnamed protein product [Echinostoma caproni]
MSGQLFYHWCVVVGGGGVDVGEDYDVVGFGVGDGGGCDGVGGGACGISKCPRYVNVLKTIANRLSTPTHVGNQKRQIHGP